MNHVEVIGKRSYKIVKYELKYLGLSIAHYGRDCGSRLMELGNFIAEIKCLIQASNKYTARIYIFFRLGQVKIDVNKPQLLRLER